MRKLILWSALMLLVAGIAAAEQSVDQTHTVPPGAAVSIENIAGSVTITGTEGSQLRITGTMGDDVEELEVSIDDEELYIEVVIPDDDDWKGERKIAADLTIQMPGGADLEVETVSATIDIRGVSAEIEAGSVSGAVTVAGGMSDIDVESVSGSVTISGGSGSVVAESVSGRVMMEGVSGDIEATTVSGEIHVDAGVVNDVEIESVAGGVFFKGQLVGDLEVESHSGNVEILLPADLSADFELETFSGRIENGFGPPARRIDRHAPGLSAEFYTGQGGADVSVETFSGNIVLSKF